MTRAEVSTRDKQMSNLYIQGASFKDLMDRFGMSMTGVRLSLTRSGALVPLTPSAREERNQKMREYKAQGHTMQEVADKFGVNVLTAQQVCKGIAPQKPTVVPINKGVINTDDKVAPFINARIKSTLEYAGNYTGCDGRADLRCKVCGEVFNRAMGSIRHGRVACPKCAKRKADEVRAVREEEERIKAAAAEAKRIEKAERRAEREREAEEKRKARIHPCPVCGSLTDRPKYCSERCAKKVANAYGELRRRNLIKSAMVDKDITVDGLYIRDKGRCAICGGHCDWDDYTVRNGTKVCGDWYPSVDHIIPLAKGGLHSWDNVQLAHRRCNWEKSDKV